MARYAVFMIVMACGVSLPHPVSAAMAAAGPLRITHGIASGDVTATEAVAAKLAMEQVASESLIDRAATIVAQQSNKTARSQKNDPIPEAARQAYQPPVPSEPPAIREAMLVMQRGAALPLHQAMPLETDAFCRLAGTAQSKEKIAAFFNRKK